jgi:hypothetical protein
MTQGMAAFVGCPGTAGFMHNIAAVLWDTLKETNFFFS